MNKLLLSFLLLNVGFAVSAPVGTQEIVQMLQQGVERNPQAPVIAPQPAQAQAPVVALPLMSARKAQALLASALALMAYFGTRENNGLVNGLGFYVATLFAIMSAYILIDR